jgi:hypothetical protein
MSVWIKAYALLATAFSASRNLFVLIVVSPLCNKVTPSLVLLLFYDENDENFLPNNFVDL